MLYGMGILMVPAVIQLVKLFVIGLLLAVQGSAGYDVSPSPAIFSEISPIEGMSGPFHPRSPISTNAPSIEPQQNGSSFPVPALPPLVSAPEPQTIQGVAPSHSPSTAVVTPPLGKAPTSLGVQGTLPSSSPSIPTVSPPPDVAPPPLVAVSSTPPNASRRKNPVADTPVSVPAENSTSKSPQNSPVIHLHAPEISPISAHQRNASFNIPSPPRELKHNQPAVSPVAPSVKPSVSPVPVLSPTEELPKISPAIHPIVPGQSPSTSPGPVVSHESTPPPSVSRKKDGISVSPPPTETPKSTPPSISRKKDGIPVSPPPAETPKSTPPPSVSRKKDGIPVSPPPAETPKSTPPPSVSWKKNGIPVSPPPAETPKSLPPISYPPTKGSFSAAAPAAQNVSGHFTDAPVPSLSSPKFPPNKGYQSPAFSPSIPFHRQNHARNKSNDPAPGSSYAVSPTSSKEKDPASPPSLVPASQHTHYTSPSSPVMGISPAPSPFPTAVPVLSPKDSPPVPSSRSPKTPLLPPFQAFPPPPPNEDCSAIVCTEPYANTPPGSPCGCVLPMQVGLRLSVALYTFFPLVSELAQEIASGVFMKQSQVRIIGANAASQQPEKTIVLIDLVPLGQRFDNTTAFLTYQRLWHKQVVISASLFGEYEVLYVRYLGLPPSPPMAPSGIAIIDDGPYSGNDNNARTMKPLGVDVGKKQHKNGLSGAIIAVIALSGAVALVLCSAVACFLLYRHRHHASQMTTRLQHVPPPVAKPSGGTVSMVGSALSSASLSFGSSIATYTGSAKTFSASDIERATNNFDSSSILGEGGFGRVYSGILEDGTKVAVKILKRDDQQGGREFLAEIEMLSRLHHRNLVKLIGICTEEHARCLVYELIPNGSVESHLHGVDKETYPLDWNARIKIALGAARGLAYLHEDSSPRVIHRDFKASNILLEHDFTPKVSDFGLARTAMDEENRHISTRVMGTFGYVAPEYAMTGHLLVKSDVYSYGVVLLELLTGRKPVDMSQPLGQENLVSWARPHLTSREGLKIIVDPSLGPDVPFDSVAKVAAIASMCVQPEVSHRPFMGEVVQALKLVCNECDEAKGGGSRSSSQDFSVDMGDVASIGSGLPPGTFQDQPRTPNYESEPDIERGLPMTQFFSTSARYGRQASGSFRRCSSSGPLTSGRGKKLWQRMRSLTGESVSDHGSFFKLWPGSH